MNLKTHVTRRQHTPNVPKNYYFLHPDMHTYQGVRNVPFPEILALFSCNTRFEIRPFALLPANTRTKKQ